ncbi:hypothetical protein HDU90_008686 [Geranomyces variabilis]|nr:hypothetical protein HDU90_008686 [Geranomyces variabilis]
MESNGAVMYPAGINNSYNDVIYWSNPDSRVFSASGDTTFNSIDFQLLDSATLAQVPTKSPVYKTVKMNETENSLPADAPEQSTSQEADPIVEAIAEKTKPKRPQSAAQMEAMRKAQAICTENLLKMKELKAKQDEIDKKEAAKKAKEADKLKAQRIIEAYEKEKERIKLEKRQARLQKAGSTKPKPATVPVSKPIKKAVPAPKPPVEESESEESEDEYTQIAQKAPWGRDNGHAVVEFDNRSEDSSDDYMEIFVYRCIKETYDSRYAANPIKLVIDSNSLFLRPQRSYLSAKITCYNPDGSVNTTAAVSSIGVMSCFRTMTVKVGGKMVDSVEDLPQLIADTYQTVSPGQRKYLKYNEGVGDDSVFKNSSGSFVVKHHLLTPVFRPVQGQSIPLCCLPNQAVEVTLTLSSPQNAFTNAVAGSYFVVSDVRYVAQLITPLAAYLTTLWQGIRAGKFLEIDMIGVNQIQNTCSGASQNNFILPLANSRVIGITNRFRKSDAYTSQTGDKSAIYDTAGLKEWRYQLGNWRMPLTENFKVEDAIMIRNLSMNDNTSYQNEDLDFDDFYTKNFMMSYSWVLSDEDENSSLNMVGSDGNLRLITIHNPNNTPSTDVSLLSTIYTQRTLLIGETVNVV